MIGVYKITSPSGKIYIGQSINIDKRKYHYSRISNCSNQPKLYNSLKKYGWSEHTFEIIEECKIKNLNKKERFWQEYYNCTSESGLNCVLVNSNSKPKVYSKETRKKMSKSLKGKKGLKGKNNPMYGMKGKDNPLYKVPRSEITKLKISKSKKGVPNKAFVGMKQKDISIKMRKISLGNKSTSKLVLDLGTGIFYDSLKEACISRDKNYSTSVGMLNGRAKNKSNLIYV